MARERAIKLPISRADYEHNLKLLEQLRYAGVFSLEGVHDIETDPIVLIIYCPKGLRPTAWSEMNVERMKTFGYKPEVVMVG